MEIVHAMSFKGGLNKNDAKKFKQKKEKITFMQYIQQTNLRSIWIIKFEAILHHTLVCTSTYSSYVLKKLKLYCK